MHPQDGTLNVFQRALRLLTQGPFSCRKGTDTMEHFGVCPPSLSQQPKLDTSGARACFFPISLCTVHGHLGHLQSGKPPLLRIMTSKKPVPRFPNTRKISWAPSSSPFSLLLMVVSVFGPPSKQKLSTRPLQAHHL